MAWALVVLAGLFETGFALSLKASNGFTRLVPSVLFVVCTRCRLRPVGRRPAQPAGRARVCGLDGHRRRRHRDRRHGVPRRVDTGAEAGLDRADRGRCGGPAADQQRPLT